MAKTPFCFHFIGTGDSDEIINRSSLPGCWIDENNLKRKLAR
jgi:hypothetical protein